MFSYFDHFEYDLGQNHRLLLPADHSMKIVLSRISTYFSEIHLNTSREVDRVIMHRIDCK